MKENTMSYEEAWTKLQADYLVSLGVIFKFIEERMGAQALADFEKSEVERYKDQFRGLVASIAAMLEKVAPGATFKHKMRAVMHEFQWFLGIGNLTLVELEDDHAIGRLAKCPYEEALKTAPTPLGFGRELYCRTQCNMYVKGVCKEVLGFDLSFAPQKVGCVYTARRLP